MAAAVAVLQDGAREFRVQAAVAVAVLEETLMILMETLIAEFLVL